MIKLDICASKPLSGFYELAWTVPTKGLNVVYMQFPAWRPGRYRLQSYARHLLDLSVTDANGQALPFGAISKDRWEIALNGQTHINVCYRFYAREMDAGGSWLDGDLWYINFINMAMQFIGLEEAPISLGIDFPANYEAATPLPQQTGGQWLAKDYATLVDSPFLAATNLERHAFEVGDTYFQLVIHGHHRLEVSETLKDLKSFTESQLAMFGQFPTKNFMYLMLMLPYKHYHGVEHLHATVIVLGPGYEFAQQNRKKYLQLLGVSSHELFHIWNVKTMVPKAFVPYDFSREAHFLTGFVVEGATTYYGDLMLARAGVFSESEYLDELGRLVQHHQNKQARFHQSLADASTGLWLDGYQSQTPGRGTSIYVEGALATLLLDLKLRQESDNRRSMDQVMRQLWGHYGKTGIGYTYTDFINVVSGVAGKDYRPWFEKYVESPVSFLPDLDDALAGVGLQILATPSPKASEGWLGMKLEQLTVKEIWPGAPTEEKLMVGDELVAINGWKAGPDPEPLLAGRCQTVQKLGLTVFRSQQLLQLDIALKGDTFYQHFSVAPNPDASVNQQHRFKHWMAGK